MQPGGSATSTGLTSRLSLPSELQYGRYGMAAIFLLYLGREAPGFLYLDSNVQLALAAIMVVAGVTWTWFWLRLAALPDRAAQGVAVAIMTLTALLSVEVRTIGIFPFYYAVVVAGAAYRWRIGAVLAAGVTIFATFIWWQTGLYNPSFLQSPMLIAAFGGAAVIVRRYIGAQLELDQTRDELRRLAAAEARAQLARDLHDQLGQTLTVTVMQAELLTMDLTDSPTSAISDTALIERSQIIASSSREALTLMRAMVTEIRSPGLLPEIAVARQLLPASGINCVVDVDETAAALATGEVDQALGWVVREAVTNVMRHSGATNCTIVVKQRNDSLWMQITDDGVGPAIDASSSTHSSGGNGLAHMSERVNAVGGAIRVTSSSADGGYCLTVEVPTGEVPTGGVPTSDIE